MAFVDTWFQEANRIGAYTVMRSCHHDARSAETLPSTGRRLPQTACYDQIADPYQSVPLEELDDTLVDQIHAWRSARLEEYMAFTPKQDTRMDVDLMEQLSALGYVDEGER